MRVTANELHTRPKNRVPRHQQRSRDFESRPTSSTTRSETRNSQSRSPERQATRSLPTRNGHGFNSASPPCLPYFCSVSCAQCMTVCMTLKGCAMSHQCAMLKTSVLHKYDEWMCHTQTLLLAPWRLSTSSSQHCKGCQVNTFKNNSCSPFEINICWKSNVFFQSMFSFERSLTQAHAMTRRHRLLDLSTKLLMHLD